MNIGNNIKRWLASALFLGVINFCSGQDEPVFPTPEGNPNQLFYLQRTPNANTIVYELNSKDGELDKDNPIHVFWIRYGEKGQRAELSGIQRKFAYGISTRLIAPETYEIRFNAYKKSLMYLKKGKDNQYHVYDTINQKEAILYKLYLKIDGGSLFSPNIVYAEKKGVDPDSGAEVAERVKIEH